jgi:hypothetical protein
VCDARPTATQEVLLTRRVLILACMVVAVLVPDPARAAWGTDNQHQLVPAYFHPGSWNTPDEWTRMCDAMNGTGGASTAVMNPNGGPGASADADYGRALPACHARGQQVIGYVHTSYGARDAATVRSDIDAYYALYPGIDGVFLDEMSTDPATASYYSSLYQYVRGKPGSHVVVGNPAAAASSAWQLTTPVADAVVVFEGTAADYALWSPPSWVGTQAASSIANLVYATPDAATLRQVCSSSKARNAGSMYVTDDVPPNPWDRLPGGTLWSDSVAACR